MYTVPAGNLANEDAYTVITADVVASRNVDSFLQLRDEKLSEISAFHLKQHLILSPYTVTAWDEFQVILAKPEHTPHVILDIRRIFFPLNFPTCVMNSRLFISNSTSSPSWRLL